jgi:hypothetical protein
MPELRIETGWPTHDLWPNARPHFMRLHSVRAAAKKEAYWSTCVVRPRGWQPPEGRVKLTIYAHPSVNRTRDDDNLVAACKGHIDGIAEALHVNDSTFDLQPIQWGDLHQRGKLVFAIGDG